ncbi:MAG: cobalamin B12-binding domain-containing protein [Nitrospirae bacterium]|nr:cobalamin B12-binding domain-containing protein [Nitrospirota bacterium]
MKILIISTNRNQFPVPVIPLGACMVADAAQKNGHEVRLLDMMFERKPLSALRSELAEWHPDVIGLSVRNIDNNDMHSPSFFLKELVPLINTIRGMSKAAVVLGGAAVSVMPEELLRYTGADMAVLGDGETVFPALLDRLSRNESLEELSGVAKIEDGVFYSITCSPSEGSCKCASPHFSRWINIKNYLNRLSTVPLQTKLGCHFKCIYCTYRKIEGSRYRLVNPEEVADTVEALASRKLRDIEFVDNVFNSPYDHAVSICEKLAEAKCGASLTSLELNPLFIDDELITAMEKAGFSGIGITVESASDRVLEGLKKGFATEHVHKSAEVIRRHKLPCVWIFMMGGPNESEETVRETLRFAENSIRLQDVAFFGTGIRIYPGTELEAVAREEGLLSLSADKMLEPVFYFSPMVEYGWVRNQIKTSMSGHMNFINSDSLSLPLLPVIHRLGYRIGLRHPLWKHTRFIRRTLRMTGMDA